MSRRPNLIPSRLLNVALPEDVLGRLALHLYSDLEQRVPHGAYSRFLTERIREHFAAQYLDLAPWTNADPGAFIVSGPPEAIALLKRALTGDLS